MKKPNILFIMCDQMRYDALGCNGNKVVRTPNVDRLAQSGVNFKNAFTPCPICVPARASLTTGCYPHKCTGTKNNAGSIKGSFPLLAEEFNRRGYETYAMGKLHYLPYSPRRETRTLYGFKTAELTESGRMLNLFDPEGKADGIEDYHDYLKQTGWGGYSRGNGLGNNDVFPSASPIPEEHYVDAWVADRTLYHLERHMNEMPDRPFFMFSSFPKPHSAYDPPRPYDSMYDPREIDPPTGCIDDIRERGIGHLISQYYRYGWDTLSPEARRVIKAHYYGLISFQDRQIGRLLDFLAQKGLSKDTIIVYTADHGDLMGDFGLYFKMNFYNPSVRVPLIISFPGHIPDGKFSEEPAGLQDLLPTLLSLIGEPLDKAVDGIDLSGAIFNGERVRDYYISQCGDTPNQQYMVCGRGWKYIYHEAGGIEELYNMEKDALELENLANDTIKREMRDYLIKWCLDNGDTHMLDDSGRLAASEPVQGQAPNQHLAVFGRRYY